MSEQLFTVEAGYRIELEDGTTVDVLPVDGAPGGDGDVQDAAGPGSIALDYTNGTKYTKTAAGAGADKWTEEATKDYVDATAGGLSWREPAKVFDSTSYANLAAAVSAMNSGSVDGIAVVDGDRILYDNITGENKNVFIVSGTPGSGATLVEDSNAASDGDAIFIQEGTNADKQFSYTGSAWVQVGGSTSSEIGFIRAFIGKDANGSELPAYTSTNYVANNDTLEVAIGKLDAQVDLNATAAAGNASDITNLGTEVDAIEAALGAMVDANGDYVAFTGTNYIDGNASVAEDLTDLDTAIDGLQTQISGNDSDISGLQSELDATQTGAGLGTGGTYTAHPTSNYLKSADFTGGALGESLHNADLLLDAQIKQNADDIIALQAGSSEDGFIRSFIGKDAAGSEVPNYANANNITQNGTLEAAIGELDGVLGAPVTNGWVDQTEAIWDNLDILNEVLNQAHGQVTDAAAGTSFTAIDTVPTGEVLTAKWTVHIQDGTDIVVWEVLATHDKDGATAATNVDFTKYAKLRIGNGNGTNVRVVLSGTDMVLEVKDAGSGTVNAVREVVMNSNANKFYAPAAAFTW